MTSTKQLIEQIARLARERMTGKKVVSFDALKDLKKSQSVILVIEDEETTRNALRRILDSAGYAVLMARDGIELTKIFAGQMVDLILCDVGLPWINGYELAEMMKAHPDLSKVPLVFVSGHSEMTSVKKGFAVGAHDYITKPFEIEKVLKTVDTLLQLGK